MTFPLHGNSYFSFLKIDTLLKMFNAVLLIKLLISSIDITSFVSRKHHKATRADDMKSHFFDRENLGVTMKKPASKL